MDGRSQDVAHAATSVSKQTLSNLALAGNPAIAGDEGRRVLRYGSLMGLAWLLLVRWGYVVHCGGLDPLDTWLTPGNGLQWCSEQGLLTCSDLQYLPEDVLPGIPDLHSAWSWLQGHTSAGVAEVLNILALTSSLPGSAVQRVQRQSDRKIFRPCLSRATPRTLSEDEMRRRTVSREAVELSWNWAPGFGLGRSVPDFMKERRQAMQVCRLLRFEAKLIYDSAKNWKDMLQWFASHNIQMPEFGWPGIYIEDYIEALAEGKGPSVGLALYLGSSG